MKKIIVLIMFSWTCFCACKNKPADIIADAKNNCAKINNNLKDYTERRVDDLTTSTPTNVTGYYRESELKKINAEYYGENGRTFTEYYFDDGMMICVLTQSFIYNKPNTYTEEVARRNNDSAWYDDRKTKIEMSRFYFNKNNLIEWNNNGKEISSSDPSFIDMQSRIVAQAFLLVKELKSEDKDE